MVKNVDFNQLLFSEEPSEKYWENLFSLETDEVAELKRLEELMLSERDPFFKGDRRIPPDVKAELEADLDARYGGCVDVDEDHDFEFRGSPPLSIPDFEDIEEYGDPYGPWFRPIFSDTNCVVRSGDEEVLSYEDTERVLDNLRLVYSEYAINIATFFAEPSMIMFFADTLVSLAGYRDHYGEPWMEQFIPTIATASRMFPLDQMRISNQLKKMFECEEDIHGFADLWRGATGRMPDQKLIEDLCLDVLLYGHPLVERAIYECSGINVKSGKCDPREIYETWLTAARVRDWKIAEEICRKAGSTLGDSFVPHVQPDILFRYYEIKFGSIPDDGIKDRLLFMASSSSAECVVHSMSMISPKDFSMEKLVVLHYSKESTGSFSDYLERFEQVPIYCSKCGTLIPSLEENYPYSGPGRCYRCGGDLETHSIRNEWSGIEGHYSVRINDNYDEWSCDYCAKCGIHFQFQDISEIEDENEEWG